MQNAPLIDGLPITNGAFQSLCSFTQQYRSKFQGGQLCPFLDGHGELSHATYQLAPTLGPRSVYLGPCFSGRLLWQDGPWFLGHAEVQRRLGQCRNQLETVACSSGISWMVAVNLFTRNISNESKHDAPAATWQLTAARLQSDLARLCGG